MPHSKLIFDKPSLTTQQQLELLSQRGLTANDPEQALFYLQFIGYYRLTGYARYYYTQATSSQFKPGTTFEAILNLYLFDRELRLLTLDAIERIEVAARTVISDTLANRYQPHWYLDPTLFTAQFRYAEFINTLQKETSFEQQGGYHPIFKHYYTHYHTPAYPPSWMLAEGLTLGTWSKLFAFLKHKADKQAIAEQFRLPAKVLQSWLHSLCHLRNLCAHHGIVWNRHFHTLPIIPHGLSLEHQQHFKPNHLVYAQLAMLHVWLQVVAPHSHWPKRLHELLQKYPSVPLAVMGFPASWFQASFWQLDTSSLT